MMRCRCGFVMPGPMHTKDCPHYGEFRDRLLEEIEREKAAESAEEGYQKWRQTTAVLEIEEQFDCRNEQWRIDKILKQAFDLARNGK